MVVLGAFVVALIFLSPSFSNSVVLTFEIIVPMVLVHWRCAFVVVMGVEGLRIWFILWVMCSGLRSGSLTISR
jgi:hypothetical protein